MCKRGLFTKRVITESRDFLGCRGFQCEDASHHDSHLHSVSDSAKCRFSKCRFSVLNLKFDFISDGGCTREKQIALSLKRHLFPHGGREPKAFWICFSRVHPPSEIKSNFKFKTLKRHLLKRHLTLSECSATPAEPFLEPFSNAVSRTLLRTLLRRRVVARPPWCAPYARKFQL